MKLLTRSKRFQIALECGRPTLISGKKKNLVSVTYLTHDIEVKSVNMNFIVLTFSFYFI